MAAIGYLASVDKVVSAGVSTLPTLLAEAARSAAESWYAFALVSDMANSESTEELQALAQRRRSDYLTEYNQLNREIFAKLLERHSTK